MITEAHTMTTAEYVVEIPAPRAPSARPATASMAVRAASAEQTVGEHPELVAARLVGQAATVSWVGRLALLVAVGLIAVLVLLP